MSKQAVKLKSEERVIHYPTLKTVLLIEEAIKELRVTTKTNLFKYLGNRVMWPTMETVLDYLLVRGMIVYDRAGKIVWVYNPRGVLKWKRKRQLEIKK